MLCEEILNGYEDEKKSKFVFASRSKSNSQDYYPAQAFNDDVYFYRKTTESFCVKFKAKNHQLLDMQHIFNNFNDYDYFLMVDSAWDREKRIEGKLGIKVICNKICINSVKPWTLPIIGYKMNEVTDQKYSYINEFFIQKKDSIALVDLFYDTSDYINKKNLNTYREFASSNGGKNCAIGAINTYFNDDDGPYEEKFTLVDWVKGLDSSIMSCGVFVKPQQLSIVYRDRKYKKVVKLR
jgi:hypothetical protein